MISSTCGFITCAMLVLLCMVLLPYSVLNSILYLTLRRTYPSWFPFILLSHVICLQLITAPFLLVSFLWYVRYAHGLGNCVLMLALIYCGVHASFWHLLHKPLNTRALAGAIFITLVGTALLLAVYMYFFFDLLCTCATC